MSGIISGAGAALRAPLSPTATALLALLVLLAAFGVIVLLARLERRREAELQTLAAIAQAVFAAADDPAEIAEAAYVHCARLLSTDFFQLGMFQGDLYRTLIWVRDGSRVHNREFQLDAEHEGLVGYVRRTGEPLLVTDFRRAGNLPAYPSYSADDPPASGLFVPLAVENTVVGIMAVQSRRVGAFRRRELLLMRALAGSVASSLAAMTWRGQVRSRDRQIALVEEVAALLTPLQPLSDVLPDVASRIQRQLEAGMVAVFELSGDQTTAMATSGRPDTRSLEQAAIRSIVQEAAASRALISRSRESGGAPSSSPHLTWECVCPLRVQDRVLGVLYVSRRNERFRRADRRLIEVVSNQLALAFLEAANYNQQQEEAWFTTVLLEVARHAAQPGDVTVALQAVLHLTTLLAGAGWTLLLTIDPVSGALVVRTGAGLRRFAMDALTEELFSPESFQLGTPPSDQEPIALRLPPVVAAATGSARAQGSILTDGTRLLGLLLLEGEEIEPRRRSLIAGIARQISLRLENAALVEQAAVRLSLERELETARAIQQSFLPGGPPEHDGWKVGAYWRAARSVGGDFYDFIRLPSGPSGARWGLAIADVSDKGVPAALYMALTRTLLRSIATADPSPAGTLARLNNLLLNETRGDMFVSVWYGIWEPERGRVIYANAGHNPPILFEKDELGIALRTHQTVLGVLPDVPYEEAEVDLAPGSMLLLYTDGVSEAPGQAGEQFGMHRIENTVLGLTRWDPDTVLSALAERVAAFSGLPDPQDDLTIVCLHRL
ncbi:MAG TPA: SpoIIE family protein phosphatase [Anaerolineales bacterium]|nr:SpoIIE family protein phosphatase [Anaerolineales bacterium]